MSLPHALITGGSRGIGFALARRLFCDGYNLSLVARNQEGLDRAAIAISREDTRHPNEIATHAVDLRMPESVIERLKDPSPFGTPELVVCAAGIARPRLFDDLSIRDFRELLDVNFLSAVAVLKSILPQMKDTGRGRVVLISSGAGLVGLYGQTAYGASKFALRGLAEALRAELRSQNIAVSICYPPNTDTDMLKGALVDAPDAARAVMNSARTVSAAVVVEAILEGISNDRFDITPGAEMRLLNRLHSLIKPMLFKKLDRLADRTAAKPAGHQW